MAPPARFQECRESMTDQLRQELDGLTVTRAKAPDGTEWVPLDQYRRMEAELETLRCQIVNPTRNVHRALRRLDDAGTDTKGLHFLETAAEQLDAAYRTAFPPKGVR
jgi:hypothetical protein